MDRKPDRQTQTPKSGRSGEARQATVLPFRMPRKEAEPSNADAPPDGPPPAA